MEIVELISSNVRNVNIDETFPKVCISGGIDSTIVLYHVINDLMKGDGDKVNTFTAIFGNDYDEGKKARRVADHYGTVHTEVLIKKCDILLLFPFILHHYPFPRFNVWPWVLVRTMAHDNGHLFIGEGSDELFGYPDRLFLEGWAGQLVWVWPAWKVPCNFYGIKLHAPFREIQSKSYPVTRFYLPPDKELLRLAYRDLLPDFVIKESSTSPNHGFYKMMDMTKEELQIEAAKAWLSTR